MVKGSALSFWGHLVALRLQTYRSNDHRPPCDDIVPEGNGDECLSRLPFNASCELRWLDLSSVQGAAAGVVGEWDHGIPSGGGSSRRFRCV